jgi:hypothetical protein
MESQDSEEVCPARSLVLVFPVDLIWAVLVFGRGNARLAFVRRETRPAIFKV